MTIKASNPEEYVLNCPEDRQEAMNQLREVITTHLPDGFTEGMSYGMIGYVVPHSIYPAGYHCKPEEALPFISLASQKNFIGFYHMGLYADPELLEWWKTAYPNHAKYKLDMGKSCVRFKRMHDIPYDLIGQLVEKITVEQWIDIYETAIKR